MYALSWMVCFGIWWVWERRLSKNSREIKPSIQLCLESTTWMLIRWSLCLESFCLFPVWNIDFHFRLVGMRSRWNKPARFGIHDMNASQMILVLGVCFFPVWNVDGFCFHPMGGGGDPYWTLYQDWNVLIYNKTFTGKAGGRIKWCHMTITWLSLKLLF